MTKTITNNPSRSHIDLETVSTRLDSRRGGDFTCVITSPGRSFGIDFHLQLVREDTGSGMLGGKDPRSKFD